MTKHIYFGQVPQKFLDDGEYFEFEGRYFYYRVTIHGDYEVHIEDTVGRYMPIDIESVQALVLALEIAENQIGDQAIVEIV